MAPQYNPRSFAKILSLQGKLWIVPLLFGAINIIGDILLLLEGPLGCDSVEGNDLDETICGFLDLDGALLASR